MYMYVHTNIYIPKIHTYSVGATLRNKVFATAGAILPGSNLAFPVYVYVRLNVCERATMHGIN